MSNYKEPVSLRNGRLFNSVLTRSGPMQRTTRMRMSQDALIDAFILLYDECNKDTLRKDTSMTNFTNKYRSLIAEIKALRVNASDFEFKSVIGQGHFGEVRVVKEKQTNDIYAMKIIKKFEAPGKICSVLFEEERDIMCTATSKWLTTLQYSFQDNENLYYIMDYHSGGDLLSLLDRHEGVLSAQMARFYLAETTLAIRALHQMGYVHRDIKPDNILLDQCGHVKLADFGSAAKLSSSGLVTQIMPVGTPEYIAPEILLSLGHGYEEKTKKQYYGVECDYWSLGILAYELVVGRTPFSGSQIKATYFNIMNHKKKLKYPDDKVIPDSLKDLITKLLEDSSVRLKYDGIVKHPFFQDTNWNNIRNEVPPFVPSCSSPDDASNFIDIVRKKSAPKIEMKNCRRDFSGKQLPFIGFTFSHATDICDKKMNNLDENNREKQNPNVESLLCTAKRENKILVSKLFEAQFSKNEERENLEKKYEEKKKLLEICEKEKNKLQRDLAKCLAENTNVQKVLELERQDRKQMESNALKLISETKIKIEKSFGNQIKQLNADIEEINDKLTESHTLNNELTSNLDRAKSELLAANKEIERLKNLEIEFKNKMAEAREFKRKSVVGIESRLEKMANDSQQQSNVLLQKLSEETAAKTDLEKKIKHMESVWLTLESRLKQEIADNEDKIKKLELKIKSQQEEIISCKVQLNEKPNVSLFEEKLMLEKAECTRLRNKIMELENSTCSLIDHEATITAHKETVQVLEKELREASEDKIKLQKKLQKTKEVEEENRRKLSNLEVVVDRLEQGVIKLEIENTQLKKQVVANVQPLTSEAEARYKEKISILEDQIAKLENQLQKLRETSILDKEALKTTQTTLWKAEKDLSDAKIDIRIAKREAKTAEDTSKRLHDEIRKLNEKLAAIEEECQKNISSERQKLDELCVEKTHIKAELNQRELEIKMFKSQLEEFNELKEMHKELKRNYNDEVQKCKILERDLENLKKEREESKEFYRALEDEKLKMEKTIEELKHKISSLELNNSVLKETGAMLDEQLEDYDKFTTTQAQKIDKLIQEKALLEKETEKLQNELRTSRQNINEEKSFKLRAEQRVTILETEVENKKEFISNLQKDLQNCNALIENMKSQMKEYEEKIRIYEIEIEEEKQMYKALENECLWLKKEASTYLTNLYSLRESNYKLTQDLEEEHQMVETLQERICELQNVVTELECFHKQREVKDEATKQQQNKLIAFLQEKLDDSKKKKSITDVLFGSRNKENLVPVSSTPSKSVTNTFIKNKTPSKNLLHSPSTKEALSQLVKSPNNQSYFQRHGSLQRMHHNIPHRFKLQGKIKGGTCGVCNSHIDRNSQYSSCIQCKFVAHPKCANIAPKTCGLPQGLIKHYAKSMLNSNTKDVSPQKIENDNGNVIEGWIKILNSSKITWEKKYARVKDKKLQIFEEVPSENAENPSTLINLCPENGQVIIGENLAPGELPNTASSNLPFIVKIALVPETSCWPEQVYYLLVLPPASKTKWLAFLNNIVINSATIEKSKYLGSVIHTFTKDSVLDMNCAIQINDKLVLLGTEKGLFSLKLNVPNALPVKVEGVSKVHQMVLVPQIGVVLMIIEEDRKLVTCDHRSFISNAEAASCSFPKIVVKLVEGVEEENCLMFAVSPNIDNVIYVTVATSNKLYLLKWCVKVSDFQKVKVLETLHPCNCVLYSKQSVIVGCDKFFKIDLRDFSAHEFLDSSLKSLAFWRIGSFPMQIFKISNSEFLLCFNEFGVFVDESGRKTQCDLKWSKVPCDFAYSKPFLFVMHMGSIEVIRMPSLDPKSSDDSICTSSTATVSDSMQISLSSPRFLGESEIPCSILAKTNTPTGENLLLIEAKKLYNDDFGSLASLNTEPGDVTRDNKNDGEEFSFTSSIVNSLENVNSSTPRNSEEESCLTYSISENENPGSKKAVTFVQKIVT